jgi:hypothetical protein
MPEFELLREVVEFSAGRAGAEDDGNVAAVKFGDSIDGGEAIVARRRMQQVVDLEVAHHRMVGEGRHHPFRMRRPTRRAHPASTGKAGVQARELRSW